MDDRPDSDLPEDIARAKRHAAEVANGVALLIGAGAYATDLGQTRAFDWIGLLWAFAIGLATWGGTYAVSYAAIRLLPGLFPPPGPDAPPAERPPSQQPKRENNPNDTTITRSQQALPVSQEWGIRLNDSRLVPLRYGLEMKHITALAESVCVDGVKVLSERALDGAGIISRYAKESPKAKEFLTWLESHQLIRPIGNNQYAITDSLYDTLYDYSPTPADDYGN